MKYIITSLLVLITFNALAQKDFEGMIRYKAITPDRSGTDEKTNDGSDEIKIFFTPGKLLIRSSKDGEKDDVLVLLDSGKIFLLDHGDKTYQIKKLKVAKKIPAPTKEMIAGYSATPLQIGGNNLTQTIGRNSTLWFADSLFFTVPAKFAGNDELLMVNDNRILLKAIVRFDENMFNYGREYEDSVYEKYEDKIDLQLVAMEVIPGIQPPALFMIPDGYQIETFSTYPMVDSVAVAVDSAMAAPVEDKPAPVKKTPAKPPVKKVTPTKSPAKKQD